MLVINDVAGEQLRAWIGQRCAAATLWSDQPQPFLPDDYVQLTVLDVVRRGQDGVRYELDQQTGKLIPTVIGQREFVLRIEARAWSQELSQTAEAILLPLELALRLPSTEQLFNDLNIGLMTSGPVRQADIVVDERVQSRAVMDIRFATTIQLTDTNDAQDYIASVEYAITLHGGGNGDCSFDDWVWDDEMNTQFQALLERVAAVEAQAGVLAARPENFSFVDVPEGSVCVIPDGHVMLYADRVRGDYAGDLREVV